MIKLYIEESLKQLDIDLFITDYVGDVVNLLNNKPKPYRLIWFPSEDLYVIGNAYKYIHGNLEDAADKAGYVQLTDELHKSDSSATFVPYNELTGSWNVGGFEGERGCVTYLKTGIILTFDNITQPNEFPELYNKLNATKSLQNININTIKDILLNYKSELTKLKNQEQGLIDLFIEAGYDIQPSYTGYIDLEDYINNMNRKDNTYWIFLTDLLFYPTDIEKRLSFISSLDNVQKGIDYLFGSIMSQQMHLYMQIIQLLDDNNIPYEWAYPYI